MPEMKRSRGSLTDIRKCLRATQNFKKTVIWRRNKLVLRRIPILRSSTSSSSCNSSKQISRRQRQLAHLNSKPGPPSKPATCYTLSTCCNSPNKTCRQPTVCCPPLRLSSPPLRPSSPQPKLSSHRWSSRAKTTFYTYLPCSRKLKTTMPSWVQSTVSWEPRAKVTWSTLCSCSLHLRLSWRSRQNSQKIWVRSWESWKTRPIRTLFSCSDS